MKTYTLNVSLSRQLRDYVKGKVAGGQFHNASEVMRDALRCRQKCDEDDEGKRRLQEAERKLHEAALECARHNADSKTPPHTPTYPNKRKPTSPKP